MNYELVAKNDFVSACLQFYDLSLRRNQNEFAVCLCVLLVHLTFESKLLSLKFALCLLLSIL